MYPRLHSNWVPSTSLTNQSPAMAPTLIYARLATQLTDCMCKGNWLL